MNLSSMPKQFAAELLLYLAENESFSSIEQLLDDEIGTDDVRKLLCEISSGLMEEALAELKQESEDDKVYISKQAKEILSNLTPHEESSLLEIFGVSNKS